MERRLPPAAPARAGLGELSAAKRRFDRVGALPDASAAHINDLAAQLRLAHEEHTALEASCEEAREAFHTNYRKAQPSFVTQGAAEGEVPFRRGELENLQISQ